MQHCVIVFTEQESAVTASSFSGTILEANVSVVLAAALEDGESDPATRGELVKAKLNTLLGRGFSMGQQGVAVAKNFDKEHNISLRVNIGVELAKAKALDVNEQYKLSEKAAVAKDQAAEATFSTSVAAVVKAREIDEQYNVTEKAAALKAAATEKAKSVDEQYKVKEKADALAEAGKQKYSELDEQYDITGKATAAKAKAEEAYGKAMENEDVAKAVTNVSAAMSSMFSWGKATAASVAAKAAAAEEERKAAKAAEAAAAPAAAAPAPAPAPAAE